MVFFWLLIFFSNCSFDFCSITLCQFNKWISFYISFVCYKNKAKKRISCLFAITGRFCKELTIKRLSCCSITIWIQDHAIWCKTGLYSIIDPKETSFIWKLIVPHSNDKVYYNLYGKNQWQVQSPLYSSFDKWQLTNNQ